MSRTPDRAIDRRKLLALGAAFGTTAAAGAVASHDGTLGGPNRTFTNTLP